MMKFIATAVLIIFGATTCGAQQVFRSTSDESSGFIKHSDKLPPHAIYMKTSDSFEHVVVDPYHHILYAVVNESKMTKGLMYGHVIAINLSNDRALWKTYFNGTAIGLILNNSIPILLCSSYSEAYSPEDGSSLWRKTMVLKEIIPDLGLAIGGGSELGKGYIRAFDLYTGDTKWRFQSRFLRDLDNFVVSGDTLISFLSSTFVQIDIRTGEGYAMPLVRDDPQYNEGAMLYSAAFGLLGLLAYSALYNGHTAERSNMTIGSQLSNVHTYNGISYLATSKSILAIEPPGKILWEYKTPYGVNGHARIFEKGGRLFALYPGIITGQATNREAGAMAIQLDTSGKERAFAWLSDVKQQNLKDFVVNDKTMLIVMNNKILEMDLRTLQTISSQQFGNERLGAGLDKIVRPPYYTLSDGMVKKDGNADKLYIENGMGMKIEISKSLELVAVVPKSSFFSKASQIGPYSIYSNSLRTVICDANDQKLPVEFSGNFKSNGVYAWDWSNEHLVIIPVRDFELGD